MPDIVMDIPGITGECKLEGFTDKIVCNSISFNATQELDRSNNMERSLHGVKFEDVSINRNIDKSSVPILDYLVGAKSFKATVYILKASGVEGVRTDAAKSTVEIELDGAVVASHNVNMGESDMTEDITLGFNKITIKYRPQKEDGTYDAQLPTNFNVLKGKKE